MHFIRCVAIVGLTVATHLPQDANAMSSDNYSIPFSAANAGGTTMTSANFGLMGSVGEESASSPMNSASNNAGTGFIAQLYNVTRLNPVTGAGTNFALPANASSPSAVAFDGDH